MGHCADWNRKSFKKGPVKMADGGDVPSLGYEPEVEDYESPVELSYSASGQGTKDYGGGGRIGKTFKLDDDDSVNVGVSGSHWKGGGQSGKSLDSVDATYKNKFGSMGVAYEPGRQKVQFTFYKEF